MRDRLNSLKGNKSQKNKANKDDTKINMEETASPIMKFINAKLGKIYPSPLNSRFKEAYNEKAKMELADTSAIKNTFERTDVIQQWLLTIETNNDEIRNKIRNFHTTFNQNELNLKLEDLFANNKAICYKVNAKLKECEEELKTLEDNRAETRIKKIQYHGLKKRYMDLFKTNMGLMQDHTEKIKQKIISETAAKNIRITPEELQTIIDNGQDIQVFTDNIIAETEEARRLLQDLEERHEHLLKIERMLVEVRDLFLQIGILVEEQQDLIDRIDLQAQNARDFVSRADLNLHEAVDKQNKSRRCKIYIFIALGILAIILIAALVSQFT